MGSHSQIKKCMYTREKNIYMFQSNKATEGQEVERQGKLFYYTSEAIAITLLPHTFVLTLVA